MLRSMSQYTIVWPSGGAFAATPVPTVPFAPARLSTIAG